MSKTVFDLTIDERKNLEKELKATPYGKSLYLLANSVLIGVLIAFMLEFFTKGKEMFSDQFIYFLVLSFYFEILLKWKWLQLVKNYYDEKVKK